MVLMTEDAGNILLERYYLVQINAQPARLP